MRPIAIRKFAISLHCSIAIALKEWIAGVDVMVGACSGENSPQIANGRIRVVCSGRLELSLVTSQGTVGIPLGTRDHW